MRRDVKNAICKIYSQIDFSVSNFTDSPRELETIIMDFCIRHNTRPGKIFYQVLDGYLIMDGIYVKRIAPKLPKPAYSEEANYWEGRILEQNEKE